MRRVADTALAVEARTGSTLLGSGNLQHPELPDSGNPRKSRERGKVIGHINPNNVSGTWGKPELHQPTSDPTSQTRYLFH